MMSDLGLDKTLQLVEQVAQAHDSFAVPEILKKQAASGEPWPLRNVKLEVRGGVATIWMNRPEAMNALNETVLKELKEVVAQVREDGSVRAVIISGEGPAFVAGADIRTMLKPDRPGVACTVKVRPTRSTCGASKISGRVAGVLSGLNR